MNNFIVSDFDGYRNAKICLYMMVGQFLDINLPKEDADKYGIRYTYDEVRFDTIKVCTHNFESEGLLAWEYLGIDKPFIKFDELWLRRRAVQDEVMDDNIDYYQKFLKFSVLLIDMVTKYYKSDITLEEAQFNNIKFDMDEDEFFNKVDVCHHFHESAGENVWNFFGIEDYIVGQSVFLNKRKELCEELLKKNEVGVKKLVK